MKFVYGIFDRKALAYTQPSLMLFDNDALAIRTVKIVLNNKGLGDLISRYPEDFELWKLGSFDPVSGDYSVDKVAIANLADLVEVQNG